MEKIAIIAAIKDPAGINIRNSLIELFGFEDTNKKFDNNEIFQYDKIPDKIIKSYLINDDLIFAENIDKRINADILIFASKHRSKENTPSLTVHPIGNFGDAEFGGRERELCPSSAVLLKNLFLELSRNGKGSGYEMTLEATHHGPFVEKPAVFAEIGSTEKEWGSKPNGKIIARTIMDGLKNPNRDYKAAVAIGGPHYCSNFNKAMLRTDIAISHICPKYNLEKLDRVLIEQSIQKTAEKADFVLLDWKGLGKEKGRIVELLESMNLKVKRTEHFL
ncbi:hypothetical protein HYS31_06835 [Candidatus Woesearchaeota archaeon]|nr:hypothetical protein [Candidatus Woesearchaeota archaeon]